MTRFGLLCLTCTLALVPAWATAHAAPGAAWVVAEDGTVDSHSWTNCESRVVSFVTSAPADARPVPEVGTVVYSGVQVRAFNFDAGIATWILSPSDPACAEIVGGEQPAVGYVDEAFRLRWEERRHAIRATERNGVRSLAGWRLDGRTSPTIASAKRHFGRPSAVRFGRYQDCTAIWRGIGLRITFVNYGGRSACKHGFAQSAVITDTSIWAVQVASRPAIVDVTQPEYLEARDRASATEDEDWWSLAELFIPWGDPGYYPSITGRARAGDGFNRFEVWIGAGGE